MKKGLFLMVLFVSGVFSAFSQQLPTVAVAPFEPVGGVSRDEANIVTELFGAELVNTGAVRVADRVNFDKILAEMKFQLSDWSNDNKTAQLGRAINADYIIYGQFMKMGTMFYLTVTMLDINTAQRFISAKEQFQNQDQIFQKLPSLCREQIIPGIPIPSYIVERFYGRWQSKNNTVPDMPGTCIIEFKKKWTITYRKN
jgi:TolB-like protein